MARSVSAFMSHHDLLRLASRGGRGELIRGVLYKTTPTGLEHGKIVMNLGILLGVFIKPAKLGTLAASDAGVLLERDPDTVREPDLAYFSTEKLPLDMRVPGYAEVVPDLVVEVVSPHDSRREVNDKALMWLRHGVRLVWVVDPDTRTVDVHRENRAVVRLTEHHTLDGLYVLPGFTCTVSDVFDA